MKRILFFAWIAAFFISCNKHEWLDVKSNKSDLVPKSIQDFQSILDNTEVMNYNYPAIGILGTDNFYAPYTTWQSARTTVERNAYIWAPDIFEGRTCSDWNYEYKMISYANIVLEGLNKIPPSTQQQVEWNNIRGSALFYRAYAFYDLAQLFAKPWDSATASTDAGIPLRMSADVNVPSKRNTVEETYALIIEDLQEAELLLPENPLYTTRPSKAAVEGLLARLYFNRHQYDESLQWSEKYLAKKHTLLDFNTLDSNAYFKLPGFHAKNPEITFYGTCIAYGLGVFQIVDTLLYRSYMPGDLRRVMFFIARPAGHLFTGAYSTDAYPFGGIATNEIMLINAESNARMGNLENALQALNSLLEKRYAAGAFTPYTAASAPEVIDKIIVERRKELPFTGNRRWEELRRLNTEPARAKTLIRILNGKEYSVSPGDNKYTYPIPPDEIKLSGLEQNPR